MTKQEKRAWLDDMVRAIMSGLGGHGVVPDRVYADARQLLAESERVAAGLEDDDLSDNQPCEYCGAEDGVFIERGFSRCNNCGEPSQ